MMSECCYGLDLFAEEPFVKGFSVLSFFYSYCYNTAKLIGRVVMFGLGGQELILILFVVLLFFGPSKLPELARGLGKGMREFKKAQADLEHEFNKVAESAEAEHASTDALASKEAQRDLESKKV